MIRRYVLHVEFHRGPLRLPAYRPRISLRRAPRAGQRTVDGGVPGTLVTCRECDGEGLLHQADDGVRRPRPEVAPPIASVAPVDASEEAARAHPLHRVISDALRWNTTIGVPSGTPTDHLWATAYGGARTWHADPDEVATGILRAIAAAPAGPVTREAWTRLRQAVTR